MTIVGFVSPKGGLGSCNSTWHQECICVGQLQEHEMTLLAETQSAQAFPIEKSRTENPARQARAAETEVKGAAFGALVAQYAQAKEPSAVSKGRDRQSPG